MDDELKRITKIPGSVIFLHFFLFFFTAVYLQYRKSTHSWDYNGNCKRMKVCGWILIIFAILLTISTFPDTNLQNYIVIWILWGLAGFYTIHCAKSIIKKANKYLNLYNPPAVNNEIDYDFNINLHNEYNFNDTFDYDGKPKAAPQYKVITCPNCGAKMKIITGSVIKCEYCDTPLDYSGK
jgi:hypothetical protein